MKIVTEFPHRVRTIENQWIPLADGSRLAARLWLPQVEAPVPAVLEYIPYRKRDAMRERDEPIHAYFAGHGYAAVRVDIRGSGDSDGVLRDEYTPQELDDARDVLRWIAAQPWCDGAVGMMGKSWGGFNALQVAALQPPELRAVITVCSTDDRYADDAHYMGGCLLGENLIWGSLLFALAAQPPDPELVGDRWRTMWRERLESAVLHPAVWMRHPRRDDYWRHGSVCEDFAAIRCPVYAVGGWADGYSNAVPRLLAGLRCPRKGLIGPWAHLYPHQGVPGPAIGFLQECLRWWDRWLRGEESGIMDEPMLRAWMQESVPPASFYSLRPGRWVAEPDWPSGEITPRQWELAPGRLAERVRDGERPGESEVPVCTPLHVGLHSGSWCSFGSEGDLPGDQREEDAASVCFDSEPLPGRLEILGAPRVTLRLFADRPDAMVAVRLNEVDPTGTSTRVTYGLLNLTHRDSHADPRPLTPGEPVTATVPLNDVAHAFAPGNRIRIAVSTSYWPVAWPSPETVTLTLLTPGSFVELPVRLPRPEDDALEPFAPPEAAPMPRITDVHPGGVRRLLRHDAATGETVHHVRADLEADGEPSFWRVEDINLEGGYGADVKFTIRDGDPNSACIEIERQRAARRGAWSAKVRASLRLTSTASAFRLEVRLEAREGDTRVSAREWDEEIPRDLL